MEEKNVFTAKTVDEALDIGLKELGLTLGEVDYEVLEEGKKKLFGSVKAVIKIIPKGSVEEKKPAVKAVKEVKTVKPAKTENTASAVGVVEFIDGLLNILGVTGKSQVVSEDKTVLIDIKTESSARVIGKRGDVLDAIQCIAGAVANIGRDEYKKVVVDCENYRAQREQTLKDLAEKLAKKAVESGRKIILEPMTPYERRVIHSALAENTEVKTASEGREPVRYIVVIPNNAKPGDRGIRYGERRHDGHGRGDRRHGEKRFDKRRDGDRKPSGGGAKRGKKEIHFGTFLGNSNDTKNDD